MPVESVLKYDPQLPRRYLLGKHVKPDLHHLKSLLHDIGIESARFHERRVRSMPDARL